MHGKGRKYFEVLIYYFYFPFTSSNDDNLFIEKIIESLNRLKTELDKPLVVMLPWLMAKQNHIRKYAQLYIDHGFDVMTVNVTPWQVMWPKKGIQVSNKQMSFSNEG